LVLLFITGQKFSNFPDYLLNSLEISQGYSSAMYYSGPSGDIYIGFFAIGLLFYMLINSIFKRKPNLLYFILINAGFLFVSFKHGFVRHDAHVNIFFANTLLVFAFMWIANKKQFTLPLSFLSLILMGVLIVSIITRNQNQILPDVKKNTQTIKSALLLATGGSAYKTDLLQANKQKLQMFYHCDNDILKYIDNKTIDVMPWEISWLFAYDLKWTPRPIFQCYSAYTDKLDMLNAKFFESNNAPELLLYSFECMDKRYSLFDAPATFRTILKNYKPVSLIDDKSMILQKSNTRNLSASKTISVIHTEIGRPIPVPKIKDGYLFAKIDMDYNLLGKTAKLFLKPPGVKIRLTVRGNTSERRFIFSSAKNGIFLSQYIPGVRDLFTAWEEKINDNYAIDLITIYIKYPQFFDKNIQVEFFEVPFK
jgi:hypothetical protein